MGLTRNPKGELTFMAASGALRPLDCALGVALAAGASGAGAATVPAASTGAAGAGVGAGWEVTAGRSKVKTALGAADTAASKAGIADVVIWSGAPARAPESACAAERAVRAIIPVTAAETPHFWLRSRTAAS